MSSHAYILYMVACKPFQTAGINSYVLANETFYSALIIAIFIFSDATPERNIKFGAGVALIISLILLILANILTNLIYMIRGRDKLKQAIKESKLKRAEKEALERAEEEERKLKKKKEEEEFTKLHDETQNLSSVDQSSATHGNTTVDQLNTKSNKKKRKSKTKGNDDNVAESGVGGVHDSDFQPQSKKRKSGKDKNRQDDLAEGTVGGDGEKPEGKRRKKSKKTDPVTTNTGAAGTEFGTQAPTTTKDFL